MSNDFIARCSIEIKASVSEVWEALTDPAKIKKYMFDTTVITDWTEGGPIYWKGEWNGRSYEDKGEVLKYKPQHLIEYSHFSPLTGLPDEPGNYHKVKIELIKKGELTEVRLAQDNNPTESDREHSEENWNLMLSGLKKMLEQ